MSDLDDIPPPPDTLPPTKDDEPSIRELMNVVLATRDAIVHEMATCFRSLNERIDRIEEDTLAADTYVRDQLDALTKRAEKNEQLEASRHKVVVDKLDALEGRVNEHAARIAVVESNHFPQKPLWAIAAVGAVGVVLVGADLLRRRRPQ